MKQNYSFANPVECDFNDGDKYFNNLNLTTAMYGSINRFRSRWTHKLYKKHMKVSYYFENMIDKLMEEHPETDIIIFQEDDQLYEKNAISDIVDLAMYHKDDCYVKCAYGNNTEGNAYVRYNNKMNRLWGVWGNVLTMEQLKLLKKFLKFARYE